MLSSRKKLSILVALPLLAAGMYFTVAQLSTPVDQKDPMSDFKIPPVMSPVSSSQEPANEIAPVEVMLVGLKQRLDNEPGDVAGWVLLSKSYYHLSRWQEAQAAFEKAKSLGYAGSWQPLPRIDSFSQKNSSTQSFNSTLEFRDYGNTTADADKASTDAIGLRLKVSLNPDLAQEIPAASAVFVFARSAGNPGPPLAVVRKTVTELPFEVALNDSHAMIPGKTISSVENVVVGARISISGNAQRHPGDYEKLSESIPANFGEMLELVISDRVVGVN